MRAPRFERFAVPIYRQHPSGCENDTPSVRNLSITIIYSYI